MNFENIKLKKIIGLGIVTVLFSTWSFFFIKLSSFLLRDGKRYFCLFDDAMISMRYAWNLAHGEGLVWNPGEYVEGFTNFLWTIYMALCASVLDKSDAVLGVQISGVLLMLITAYFTMLVGEQLLQNSRIKDRGALSVLIFSAALLYYPMNYWTLMGMETGMITVFLMAALWLTLRTDGEPHFTPLIAILLGCAFLTRPDTAIAVGLIMIFRLSGIIKRNGWVKVILLEGAIIAAFVAGLSIFRFAYYGSLVPNTYTLKVHGFPIDLRIENGFLFLDSFWITIAPILIIGVIGLFLEFRRDRFLVFSLLLSIIAYQIYVGGDAWKHWRMIAPFIPGAIALAIIEIAEFVHQRGEGGTLARFSERRFMPSFQTLAFILIVCITVSILWLANRGFDKQIFFKEDPLYIKANERNTKTALALADLAKPGASVAVTWAGAIPYYSGLKAIDLLGKSDKYIASLEPDLRGVALGGLKFLPGHCKYDLDYSIKELKPTYIQNSKWGRQNLKSYVKEHYRVVKYRGAVLSLLKDSPHIKWDKL